MASLLFMRSLKPILRETSNIFLKNGRIFTSIALFTLVTNSIGYLFNLYTITPLITDFILEGTLLNTTIPGTPEFTEIITQIKKDSKFIIEYELIYFIIISIFSCLSTTATILAAAITYAGKGEEEEEDLSLKDLVIRTLKSWHRPLLTWFSTLLFCFIFFFIFGLVIFFISLIIKDPSKILLYAIPLGIIASVLYMYLAVNWSLGIVVSAVEKTKGIEAIWKAGDMIKGMKKQGFMLNLLVNMVLSVLQVGIQMISVKSIVFVVIKGVGMVYLSSLVNMYHFAAYVVIYYMCKKNHELDGNFNSTGYTKIPTTPLLVDEKLP